MRATSAAAVLHRPVTKILTGWGRGTMIDVGARSIPCWGRTHRAHGGLEPVLPPDDRCGSAECAQPRIGCRHQHLPGLDVHRLGRRSRHGCEERPASVHRLRDGVTASPGSVTPGKAIDEILKARLRSRVAEARLHPRWRPGLTSWSWHRSDRGVSLKSRIAIFEFGRVPSAFSSTGGGEASIGSGPSMQWKCECGSEEKPEFPWRVSRRPDRWAPPPSGPSAPTPHLGRKRRAGARARAVIVPPHAPTPRRDGADAEPPLAHRLRGRQCEFEVLDGPT